jgi:hypothetical protein
MKYLYNNKGSDETWNGQTILDGEYYLIPNSVVAEAFSNDDGVIADLSLGNLVASKTNASGGHIATAADAINFLKDLNGMVTKMPFDSKLLETGEKLYRRKHGQKVTINANSEKEIIFTAPYTHSKINKLEIIDANALDRVDLYVKSPVDPAVAALYGMPADYLLNQFAFDVVVSDLLYSDKSDYDADVYAGFQVIAKYKNDTGTNKEVGFNLIFHEVV